MHSGGRFCVLHCGSVHSWLGVTGQCLEGSPGSAIALSNLSPGASPGSLPPAGGPCRPPSPNPHPRAHVCTCKFAARSVLAELTAELHPPADKAGWTVKPRPAGAGRHGTRSLHLPPGWVMHDARHCASLALLPTSAFPCMSRDPCQHQSAKCTRAALWEHSTDTLIVRNTTA